MVKESLSAIPGLLIHLIMAPFIVLFMGAACIAADSIPQSDALPNKADWQ